MSDFQLLADKTNYEAAMEKQELSYVSALGLVPFKDGNMWCVLWGKNIQEGICGYGVSPIRAIRDFNAELHKQPKQEG